MKIHQVLLRAMMILGYASCLYRGQLGQLKVEDVFFVQGYGLDTVDWRNPAPPGM